MMYHIRRPHCATKNVGGGRKGELLTIGAHVLFSTGLSAVQNRSLAAVWRLSRDIWEQGSMGERSSSTVLFGAHRYLGGSCGGCFEVYAIRIV